MGARFTMTPAMRRRSVMPGAGNGGGHGLGFGPNLTPMVDVVMVILIFFMAAAAFLGPEWFLRAALPAPPPTAGEDRTAGDRAIVLPAMRLRVVLRVEGGETVAEFEGAGARPLGEFLVAFAEAAPGLLAGDTAGSITIAPSGAVAWADVIAVHEAASAAGFGSVRLE